MPGGSDVRSRSGPADASGPHRNPTSPRWLPSAQPTEHDWESTAKSAQQIEHGSSTAERVRPREHGQLGAGRGGAGVGAVQSSKAGGGPGGKALAETEGSDGAWSGAGEKGL